MVGQLNVDDALDPHSLGQLVDSRADGLIVSSLGDQSQDLSQVIRSATQLELPLLLLHPACDATLAYELDMILQDTHGVIVGYVPGMWHPAIRRLGEISSNHESPLGRILSLEFERRFSSSLRVDVIRRFAADIELLRPIIGSISKVSSMGTADDASFSSLGIQLSGESEFLVRWSLLPSNGPTGGSIQLVGEQGTARVSLDGKPSEWKLDVTVDGQTETATYQTWDDSSDAFDAFTSAIAGNPRAPDWSSVCRGVDLADLAESSLRRGRTLELTADNPTEEKAFLGMMAIGGCGMLMLCLLMFFVASLVEGLQLPFHEHWLWKAWPVFLLIPMLIFLSLQLLKFVFPQSDESSDE